MNTKSIETIRGKANECLVNKIKSKASLYDALPVDDKQLESQGLYRPAKNAWTEGGGGRVGGAC